jgi:assimilatory nitrate reductase catalytic subunit
MTGATVRTTCPYCGVGCGVLASRQSNGSVTIAGDPDHPANFGRLCSKGLALGETFDSAQRLLHPSVNGIDVPWQDATALVAKQFAQAIAHYGPDSVAFYVSGQFLTEDYYVANKLMKGFIGSANIDTNSRLCMASAVAGHKRAFGADIVPCNYTDLEEADLVVLVGSNLAWCHPVLFQRLQAAREKRGSTLVVIDPRKTMTAESADLHLQIKPGADVALFNALLRHLHANGKMDQRFVTAHTQGLDAALQTAGQPTLEAVAAETGLTVATLKSFFELFAEHPKTVTAFSMGVNQAVDGTDKVNAIINCHLLTGRIGKTGAGPFSITGQPNAMGGREVGGLANMLAAHMDIANPAHRAAVQKFWQSPTMAEKPGLKAVDLFEAVQAGKIKALWIMATNPAVSMPGSHFVTAALKTCPFVVVSDVTAQSDTAKLAHVLLPAKGWGEKDGTVTNSERRISRQRAFADVQGQAKADWQIMCDVAQAMGFRGFDFATPAEIFAEHCALTKVENNGRRALELSDFALQDYDSLAPQQWGGAQPFADAQFETTSGKANFVPTVFLPGTETSGIFTLNTGRIRDQWHTMTRTGLVPKLFAHRAEPYVEISPTDAAHLHLKDADLALIEGDAGQTILRVLISNAVRPSTIFQPMHWSNMFSALGKANAASSVAFDPVSGQPALKSGQVRVSHFAAAWYGYCISLENIAARPDYWALSPLKAGSAMECAGLARPAHWHDYFDINNADATLELAQFSSSTGFRCVGLRNGRLSFALFISNRPVSVNRQWLQQQLGAEVVAQEVMAGRPGAAVKDAGPTLCVCNAVGRNTVLSAIQQNPAANLNSICASTTAGTGCGSCRPEIQCLINDARPMLQAAE